MTDFKFLPILTQGLHLAVLDRRYRCMNGHHACSAIFVIHQLPDCVARMALTYASLMELGMAIRSSTQTQSLTSSGMASFAVRLKVLEKIFESAKWNASVYKSSLDGVLVKFVLSVPGVEGVTGADGAIDGPASSAKQNFDGVVCLIWDSVSSFDCDNTSTVWKDLAIR